MSLTTSEFHMQEELISVSTPEEIEVIRENSIFSIGTKSILVTKEKRKSTNTEEITEETKLDSEDFENTEETKLDPEDFVKFDWKPLLPQFRDSENVSEPEPPENEHVDVKSVSNRIRSHSPVSQSKALVSRAKNKRIEAFRDSNESVEKETKTQYENVEKLSADTKSILIPAKKRPSTNKKETESESDSLAYLTRKRLLTQNEYSELFLQPKPAVNESRFSTRLLKCIPINRIRSLSPSRTKSRIEQRAPLGDDVHMEQELSSDSSGEETNISEADFVEKRFEVVSSKKEKRAFHADFSKDVTHPTSLLDKLKSRSYLSPKGKEALEDLVYAEKLCSKSMKRLNKKKLQIQSKYPHQKFIPEETEDKINIEEEGLSDSSGEENMTSEVNFGEKRFEVLRNKERTPYADFSEEIMQPASLLDRLKSRSWSAPRAIQISDRTYAEKHCYNSTKKLNENMLRIRLKPSPQNFFPFGAEHKQETEPKSGTDGVLFEHRSCVLLPRATSPLPRSRSASRSIRGLFKAKPSEAAQELRQYEKRQDASIRLYMEMQGKNDEL